jgi:hypothetical protein
MDRECCTLALKKLSIFLFRDRLCPIIDVQTFKKNYRCPEGPPDPMWPEAFFVPACVEPSARNASPGPALCPFGNVGPGWWTGWPSSLVPQPAQCPHDRFPTSSRPPPRTHGGDDDARPWPLRWRWLDAALPPCHRGCRPAPMPPRMPPRPTIARWARAAMALVVGAATEEEGGRGRRLKRERRFGPCLGDNNPSYHFLLFHYF